MNIFFQSILFDTGQPIGDVLITLHLGIRLYTIFGLPIAFVLLMSDPDLFLLGKAHC